MNKVSNIVGINLVLLLIYTAALRLSFPHGDYVLPLAFAIAGHVLVTVSLSITSFSQKEGHRGGAFLLSALLVLIIGFSACLAGFNS